MTNSYSSPSIIIRKSKIEDIHDVEQAHRNSILQICCNDYNEEQIKHYSNIQYSPDIWGNSIRNDFHQVVEYQNKIEGFCHARMINHERQILALYLTRQVNGCGIARKLIFQCLDYLQGFNIAKVKLVSTLTARGFYQKIGFSVVEKTQITIRGAQLECYQMQTTLI